MSLLLIAPSWCLHKTVAAADTYVLLQPYIFICMLLALLQLLHMCRPSGYAAHQLVQICSLTLQQFHSSKHVERCNLKNTTLVHMQFSLTVSICSFLTTQSCLHCTLTPALCYLFNLVFLVLQAAVHRSWVSFESGGSGCNRRSLSQMAVSYHH